MTDKSEIRVANCTPDKFEIRNPKFEIASTLNPQPSALSSQPSTLNYRLSAPLVVTLAYMVLLFIVSSVPGSGEGGRLMELVSPTAANIAHVPAYGLLALLWILTLRDHGVTERRSMWVAFLVASGYGALTELYQFWVPGRYPSVLDVMSNIAGSLLFVWLYWWMSRTLRVESRERRVTCISDLGFRIANLQKLSRENETNSKFEIRQSKF